MRPQRQQPQHDHNGQGNTRHDQDDLQRRHYLTAANLPSHRFTRRGGREAVLCCHGNHPPRSRPSISRGPVLGWCRRTTQCFRRLRRMLAILTGRRYAAVRKMLDRIRRARIRCPRLVPLASGHPGLFAAFTRRGERHDHHSLALSSVVTTSPSARCGYHEFDILEDSVAVGGTRGLYGNRPPHSLVGAAAGEDVPIGAERHRQDSAGVPGSMVAPVGRSSRSRSRAARSGRRRRWRGRVDRAKHHHFHDVGGANYSRHQNHVALRWR